MVDFVSATNTANRLIKENGRLVTMTKHAKSTGHGARDRREDIVLGGIRAAFVNFNFREVDGSSVKSTDKKMLVAGNAVDRDDLHLFNEVGDTLCKFKIVNVRIVQPADVIILYEFQIRR